VDSLPNQTVSEATFDGGATWQRLASNQQMLGLTTVNSVTFALRDAARPGQQRAHHDRAGDKPRPAADVDAD
jgi:hypothetical protein